MTTTLGKRKSRPAEDDTGDKKKVKTKTKTKTKATPAPAPAPAAATDLQALLQKHFEARFKPLPADLVKPNPRPSNDQDDDDDDDDDYDSDDLSHPSDSEADNDAWDGLSGDDEDDFDQDEDQHVPHTVQIVDHSTKAPDILKMSKRELKAYLVRSSPQPAPLPFIPH